MLEKGTVRVGNDSVEAVISAEKVDALTEDCKHDCNLLPTSLT